MIEAVLYEPMVNREQMRQTVFEYIEVDYNRTRRHSTRQHSTPGYLSPEKYEQAESSDDEDDMFGSGRVTVPTHESWRFF